MSRFRCKVAGAVGREELWLKSFRMAFGLKYQFRAQLLKLSVILRGSIEYFYLKNALDLVNFLESLSSITESACV